MSTLSLSPDDLARLITTAARPRLAAAHCHLVADRLHLELVGLQTGLKRIPHLDATFSLRATLASPTLITADLRLEKALGPLALLIRPFLKQILQALIPPGLRPALVVESPTRLLVHLDRLQIPRRGPLTDLLTLTALEIPHAPAALQAQFTLHDLQLLNPL